MAATVTGTFVLIDRASGPLRKMETQALKTQAAIHGVGRAADKHSGSNFARKLDDQARAARSLGSEASNTARKVDSMGNSHRTAASHSDRLWNSLTRVAQKLRSVGQIFGALKMPAMAVGIGVLAQAIGSLAGGLVALVPNLVSASQAIAALPSFAAAAVQGLATFKLAFAGVGSALKAGIGVQQQSAQSIAQMAEAHRQAAQAVSQAQHGIVTAQRGVAQAEHGVMIAQRDSRQAQIQLTLARRDAARELVDLKLQAMGAALGEQRAALTLRDARMQLSQAAISPTTTALEMQDLQLQVQEAQLGITQAHVQHTRAQQDQTRAQRLGVSGNQQVVAANNAVSDSLYQEKQAVVGVSEAQYQQKQAVLALANAERALAMQQRFGNSALNAYQEALKKLSPEARTFVQQLVSMYPAFRRLQGAAGRELFPALGQALTRATRAFPMLQRVLQRTGGVIGRQMRGLVHDMTTGARLGDLQSIGMHNAHLLNLMGQGGRNLASALVDLMVAARPFTNWVANTILKWTKWIRLQAEVGRATGRTAARLDKTRAVLTQFGHILSNLYGVFKAVMRAATPLGNSLWAGAEKATRGWKAYANSVTGQTKMRAWFNSLRDDLHQMGQLTKELAIAWAHVTINHNFATTIQHLRGAVPAIERLFTKTTGLGPATADLLKSIANVLSNLPFSPIALVVRALTLLLNVVNALIKHVPFLGTILSALITVALIGKIASYAGKVGLIAKAWGAVKVAALGAAAAEGGASMMGGGGGGGFGWFPGGGGKGKGGGFFGRIGRAAKGGRAGGLIGRFAGRFPGLAGGIGRAAGFLGPKLGTIARVGSGVGLGLGLAGSLAGSLVGGRAGSTLSGMGTGAGIGATVGSVIPGVGTLLGGAAGAGIGALIGYLNSGESKLHKFQRTAISTFNTLNKESNIGGLNKLANQADHFAKGAGKGSGALHRLAAAARQAAQRLMDRQLTTTWSNILEHNMLQTGNGVVALRMTMRSAFRQIRLHMGQTSASGALALKHNFRMGINAAKAALAAGEISNKDYRNSVRAMVATTRGQFGARWRAIWREFRTNPAKAARDASNNMNQWAASLKIALDARIISLKEYEREIAKMEIQEAKAFHAWGKHDTLMQHRGVRGTGTGIGSGHGQQSGGLVPGVGHGDIVPTWLEPGEFVMRRHAVRRHGVHAMHAINRGHAAPAHALATHAPRRGGVHAGIQIAPVGGTRGPDVMSLNRTRTAGQRVLNQTMRQWGDITDRGHVKMRKTQRTTEAITRASWTRIRRNTGTTTDRIRIATTKDWTAIYKNVGSLNDQIRVGSDKDWTATQKSITNQVKLSRANVQAGFVKMRADATKELKSMGYKAADINKFLKGSGTTSSTSTSTKKHAQGGRIPGSGLQDTVNIAPGHMAAPGELIVNRHTERKVNGQLAAFGTSLGRMVAGESRRHSDSIAPGEYGIPPAVARAHNRRPTDILPDASIFRFATGGTVGGTIFQAIASKASEIDSHHYPYVWGGGHNASFSAPYDCSGAVSAVLHSAGLLSSPLVASSFRSWGSPGPGDVAIHASSGHVFMDIGGRGWGTSHENPGGGAGWISYTSRPGFSTTHVPGAQGKLGSGVGGVGGASINIPQTALLGVPGGVAQGILNAVGAGINQRLAAATGGTGMPGSVKGGPAEKMIFDFFTQAGMSKIGIAGLIGNAVQESALNWNAAGGGMWQQISNFGSGAPAPLVQMQKMLGQIRASGVFARMNAASSPEQAAIIFEQGFERAGIPAMGHRTAAARAAFNAGFSRGGRVADAGWFGGGGSFVTKGPTVFGAGEGRAERVTVSPAGGHGRPIHISIARIDYRGEGDIRDAVLKEFDKLHEDLTLMGG